MNEWDSCKNTFLLIITGGWEGEEGGWEECHEGGQGESGDVCTGYKKSP